MSEKIVVKQNGDSRFMIVHRDPTPDATEKFFGGFYNEVECPGTEDESFSWEMENWVDRPEDGAVMFAHFHDAKDFLNAIGEDKRDECAIVLYEKGDVENFILGSYWYPLKVFIGEEEQHD